MERSNLQNKTKAFLKTANGFFQHQLATRPSLQGIPFWLSALAVGFGAVLYSDGFTRGIAFARNLAEFHPYLFLGLAPLLFCVSMYLTDSFEPAAGGSGVVNTLKALDVQGPQTESELQRLLGPRVALVIFASTLLALIGGSSMGREGPAVQMSACVFYFIGRKLRPWFPAENHRTWVVAGGAAGIAAAFQTPLGGVLFVLEELAFVHFQHLKTYVLSAVVISGMIAQWLFGKYLFLGYVKIGSVPLSAVVSAFILGIVCGGAASVFERARLWTLRITRSMRLRNKLFFAGFIGLLMALMAIYINPESVGGGISFAEGLLFHGHAATPSALFVRAVGPLLSSLAGVAGGFLAPAVSLGAGIGSLFASLTASSVPNLMTLLGMAAFLAALTRAPFTALVIVMEMTDSHAAIFPLMVCALLSYGTFTVLMKGARDALAD